MADPKKGGDNDWHPDDEPNDGDGILDLLEDIVIDEDGEIRWITILVVLIAIGVLVDWQRGWVWLHGIQKVVAYINTDMADPGSLVALLS
jgi:hypothetical protein